MTRDEIESKIINIFEIKYEIKNPGLNDDLRDEYDFDSIDAIELLREIEIMLDSKLTRPEKEKAFVLRTIHQIIDYIEMLSLDRA